MYPAVLCSFFVRGSLEYDTSRFPNISKHFVSKGIRHIERVAARPFRYDRIKRKFCTLQTLSNFQNNTILNKWLTDLKYNHTYE